MNSRRRTSKNAASETAWRHPGFIFSYVLEPLETGQELSSESAGPSSEVSGRDRKRETPRGSLGAEIQAGKTMMTFSSLFVRLGPERLFSFVASLQHQHADDYFFLHRNEINGIAAEGLQMLVPR